MKKQIAIGLIMLCLILSVTQATAIRSRGVRGNPYETEDGFFGITFEHHIDIPNYGEVIILTDYASTLNLSAWKITDNKDLVIELRVIDIPDNLSLYVEHMHSDVFLEAELPQWDGILQDVMDDKYHSDLSYGFMINQNYSYSETFSIEGYSEFLTRYHTYYINNYAFTSSTDYRLTEWNLRNRWDVYGTSFRIIYDICFRGNSWPTYETPKFIIEDNIILDLDEGWTDNRGDRADVEAVPNSIPEWMWWAGGIVIVVVVAFFGVLFWKY